MSISIHSAQLFFQYYNLNRCKCLVPFLQPGRGNSFPNHLDKNDHFSTPFCSTTDAVTRGFLSLSERTFPLSWSRQPGECWWQSQYWKGKEDSSELTWFQLVQLDNKSQPKFPLTRSEAAASSHSSYPTHPSLPLPLAPLKNKQTPHLEITPLSDGPFFLISYFIWSFNCMYVCLRVSDTPELKYKTMW